LDHIQTFRFPSVGFRYVNKKICKCQSKRERNLNRLVKPEKLKQNLHANDKDLIKYKKTPTLVEENAGAFSLATY